MPVRTYLIHCESVCDFESFVAAVNEGFVHRIGAHWTGNLDAFNDFLSWPDALFKLRFADSQLLNNVLGHAAMTYWLDMALTRCHYTNQQELKGALEVARAGLGPTMLDRIREILDENQRFVSVEWV